MNSAIKKIVLKFFSPVILVLVIGLYLNIYLISIPSLLLLSFMVYFIRDPDRKIPENGIVAPADGKIKQITETKKGSIKISIFMRPFDVHVNRSPIKGCIEKIKHKKGNHIPAFKKESENNEKTILEINSSGSYYKIEQIAGFLARRIYSYLEENDSLNKGEKIGLIAFGSRVNLFLPKKYDEEDLVIKENDKVKAGKTKIASKKLEPRK